MTLFLIGLGLNSKEDISVLGLKTVKNCDFIYLESYTSILQNSKKDLEEFYGKQIIVADRDIVEKQADEILEQAANANVAFLVVGDPMCATTHVDIASRAKDKDIKVEIIHNASIISAVGVLGLEVYKYGRTASIPFHNKDVRSPVDIFNKNQKLGLHTLFLLDLDPINQKFMTIKQASDYLISKGVEPNLKAIGIARIGSNNKVIKVNSLDKLGDFDYGKAPYCIVIPGNLHFVEEEYLQQFE